MNITGDNLISAICKQLNEKNILQHDSNIINLIRTLTSGELYQLIDFGDVQSWQNDRINKEWAMYFFGELEREIGTHEALLYKHAVDNQMQIISAFCKNKFLGFGVSDKDADIIKEEVKLWTIINKQLVLTINVRSKITVLPTLTMLIQGII